MPHLVRVHAIGALGLLGALLWSAPVAAEPIAVRYTEGITRGFLTLRSPQGQKLAEGDLMQVARGDGVEKRLVFRFADGSLHDETTVFTQEGVFTVRRYHLIQRGASFPTALDVSCDRATGRYAGRYRESTDAPEKTVGGPIDLPPDVYNGMAQVLLKNLAPGATATGHLLSLVPSPRLVNLQFAPVGEESVQVGDSPRRATHYLVKTQLGGIRGLLAPLIGHELPGFHYWILREDVPAFLLFEGPLYLGGPVWRVGSSFQTDQPPQGPPGAAGPRKARN